MDIGKKVKTLRVEKLMTQSELAGGEITRNMLSQIENGIALPSISTVMYLAKRLGVSAGFLLADDNDDFIYRKTGIMKNIRKALTDKSFEICRDLCIYEFDEYDDEVRFILAQCCINMAKENICAGKLRHACANIDEAMLHTEQTLYDTSGIKNRAFVMLKFLRTLSSTLDSVEIYEDVTARKYTVETFECPLCKYVTGLENIFECNLNCFDDSVEEEKLYASHIRAKLYMAEGDYASALEQLRRIMDSSYVIPTVFIYLAGTDLEICCRETGDFRGAYEYSQNKLTLLQSMLSDI